MSPSPRCGMPSLLDQSSISSVTVGVDRSHDHCTLKLINAQTKRLIMVFVPLLAGCGITTTLDLAPGNL